MNWMGGARSRIKQKDEKRKQQEFFARMRLAKQLNGQTPSAYTPASIFFQTLESAKYPKSIASSTYSKFEPQDTVTNMKRQSLSSKMLGQNRPSCPESSNFNTEDQNRASSSQSRRSSVTQSNSNGILNQGNKHHSYEPNLKNRFGTVSMTPIYNEPLTSLDQWCFEVDKQSDKKYWNYNHKGQPYSQKLHKEPEARKYLVEDFQPNNPNDKDDQFQFKPKHILEKKLPNTENEKSRNFIPTLAPTLAPISFHDLQATQRKKLFTTPKSHQLRCTNSTGFYSPKSSDSELDSVSVHEKEQKETYQEPSSFFQESGPFSFLTPSSSSSSKCTFPGILGNEENIFASSPIHFNFERNIEDCINDTEVAETPFNLATTPLKCTPALPKHNQTVECTPTALKHAPTSANLAPILSKSTPTTLKHALSLPKLNQTMKCTSSTLEFAPTHLDFARTPLTRAPTTLKRTPTLHKFSPTSLKHSKTLRKPSPTPIKHIQAPSKQSPTSFKDSPIAFNRVSTHKNFIRSSKRERHLPEIRPTKLLYETTKYNETEVARDGNLFPVKQYQECQSKDNQDLHVHSKKKSKKSEFQQINIPTPYNQVIETVSELPLPESSFSVSTPHVQKLKQTKEVDKTEDIKTKAPITVDTGIQVDGEDLRFNYLLAKRIWYSV